MSKISSGILQNAEPLTEEQLSDTRKYVLENGEAVACIDPDEELCFLMTTEPRSIKELAWDRAEELYYGSNGIQPCKDVYRKSGVYGHYLEQQWYCPNQAITPLPFHYIPVAPSWVAECSTKNGSRIIERCANNYMPDSGICYIPVYAGDYSPTVAIDPDAFEGCDKLTYINIPPTVTSIGTDAFANCTNLVEVDLGTCEASLGSTGAMAAAMAFRDTPALRAIHVCESNKRYSSVDGVLFNKEKTVLLKCPSAVAVECYTIPAGTRYLSYFAIDNCPELKTLVIPNSVVSVNPATYSPGINNCPNLTTIIYEGTMAECPDTTLGAIQGVGTTQIQCSDGVVIIGSKPVVPSEPSEPDEPTGHEYLKYVRTAAEAVTIKGYKENIPAEVVVPQSINGYPVTRIDANAFKDAANITSVIIPDTVTFIGGDAFRNCSALANISLGKSVRQIGASCFYDCTSLTALHIPASLTTIGTYAFEECTSLMSFTCDTNNATFSANKGILYDKGRTTLVKYPPALANTSITVSTSVTTIADSAFTKSTNLVIITIPTSVSTIEGFAFAGCTNVQTFKYLGTKAQWANVAKGTGWNTSSRIKSVTCSDGTVTL